MAQPVIQTSFNSGELDPNLFARVDLAQYHKGAALIRNFYCDYRGGVSTRPGTRYVLQSISNQVGGGAVRLLPFQASSELGYIIELGANYARFYTNGAPVLEAAITGGTGASGNTFTITNPNITTSQWVFATGWAGLTNVNGNYFIVAAGTSGSQVVVTDLNGNPVTFTGTYTGGGQLQRVYTISTPYAAADLNLIKYVQNVTSLILCHPNYAPAALTLIAANNWQFTTISFGATINAPTGTSASSTLAAGSVNYSYAVTSVDINGQESSISTPATLSSLQDLRTTGATTTISWTAAQGAVSYNVYKTELVYGAAVPSGSQYGFIGNCTGTSFVDSNISPDFSQGPPIPQNPFVGASVNQLTLGTNGTYTVIPTVTIAPPATGLQATGFVSMSVSALGGITHDGTADVALAINLPNINGYTLTFSNGLVTSISSSTFLGGVGSGDFGYAVNSMTIVSPGSWTSGSLPTTMHPVSCSAPGFVFTGSGFNIGVSFHIGTIILIQGGFGYLSPPAVTISPGPGTATATLGTASAGNPAVPAFYQERLVLAAPANALQTFYMSQPGSFYNFNVSDPIQSDDAITGSIVSTELNQIKQLVTVPTGLIALTSRAAWLINGSGTNFGQGVVITPADASANSQAFNGSSDLPPLRINQDILYGQAKGSFVRDLTYNFYANIYTGTDISALSSHLFFGHQILQWAWAEEPFKTVWAIREDGQMLTLGFIKEHEFIGWTHQDTQGVFESVATITEQVPFNQGGLANNFSFVDAVYVVVQRLINGNWVKMIERVAERNFVYGVEDAWCVDAALQSAPVIAGNTLGIGGFGISLTASGNSGPGIVVNFSTNVGWSSGNIGQVIRVGGGIGTITAVNSSSQIVCNFTQPITYVIPGTTTPVPNNFDWTGWIPFTTFTGLVHLIGQTVWGLADGAVVGPLTVTAAGTVTLPKAATKVTIGLPFTAQLQTLAIDMGEPTIQGKRKKIVAATARVNNTLGLKFGSNFNNLVPMKDLITGNVGTMTNQVVAGLVSGDARTIADPTWTVPGQYCFQQDQPLPASILGVIPEIAVGDTK